jgi:hypothetical protein
MEKGHEIGLLECLEPVEVRFNNKLATELVRYKLDLVGVQEVRWDKGDTVRAGDYNFFYGKEKRKSSIRNRIFEHHRNVSAGKSRVC